MANTTFKNMALKIDNASATLTDISSYVNQVSLERAINLLEDTSLADSNKSVLTGLAGTKVSLNGFVNTTTDAIIGPMINAATSVTKTVEYRAYTGRYYNGEVLLSNIRYSGSVDNLQTFSVDATFDGAVNRTSVAL
jgi:hypothetical protein